MHKSLSGGVIAGLVVVGALALAALLLLFFGLYQQRKAKRIPVGATHKEGVALEWKDISYFVPRSASLSFTKRGRGAGLTPVLDSVSGRLEPGQMMAILGPSGELTLHISKFDSP
jgi:ABC-type transport system involved in cytochrome bd biosynthesis fused ATPase/permease subunit